MRESFSPVNRIGHFYDASVEEPQAMWQEFCHAAIDFALDWDASSEESEDVPIADDAPVWPRLLTLTAQEALGRNAVSVEFSPRRDGVVVYYTFDGGREEAATLPRGAYESFVRYLHRVADADRLEMKIAGRGIRLKIEFSQTEYGTRTMLHLPQAEVDETEPPAV